MANILISGASSGLGFCLVVELLKLIKTNEKIYIISKKKINFITAKKKNVKIFYTNLSKKKNIVRLVKKIKRLKIDIIINNAGAIYEKSSNKIIHDTVLLNAFSHVYITENILKKATNSIKVINISSFLHKYINEKEINNFFNNQKKSSPTKIYMISKLILMLLSKFLNTKYKKNKFININPGIIRTKFGLSNKSFFRKITYTVRNLIAKSPIYVSKEIIKVILKKNNNYSDYNNIIFHEKNSNKLIRNKYLQKKVYKLYNNFFYN
jgi:short-subunit dehydrogenase